MGAIAEKYLSVNRAQICQAREEASMIFHCTHFDNGRVDLALQKKKKKKHECRYTVYTERLTIIK